MRSFEKPVLNGRTDRENIHILETWAYNLVDSLNYAVSHIDDTNMVGTYVTSDQVDEKISKASQDLRAEIVRRTK